MYANSQQTPLAVPSNGMITHANPISLTVILRQLWTADIGTHNINGWVDSYVLNHGYATAVCLVDMHQYGIWWYGYSFSKTNGTWMGLTFAQLKSVIDRFHYHGWKVGLSSTAIAWTGQEEYNYITTLHPELAFTDANGMRACGVSNATLMEKNPGYNCVIPDPFAEFTTPDPVNNITAGTRLVDLYTARLTQMIKDGLQWDFWFGTDGWNGYNVQGYSWENSNPSYCYSFSPNEIDAFASATNLNPTYAVLGENQGGLGNLNYIFGSGELATHWTAYANGSINSLEGYLENNGGTTTVRLAIYDGTSTQAASLLGVSNPVQVNATAEWRTWTFNSSIAITAGEDYWFAVLSSGNLGVYNRYTQNTLGGSSTFVSGFSTLFGPMNSLATFAGKAMEIYANYTIVPSLWNSWTSQQKAAYILSACLPQWDFYWQNRFAQMYAQIKHAFIEAGESPNVFHLIGSADDSSEPNGGGNLAAAGMYNMSLLAQYKAVDYVYVDQEFPSNIGATYGLAREQAYVGALVKMQDPSLDPIIGLQPVDYLGNSYPLWEVEQSYLAQAVNYVWYGGVRHRVSAPNVIMLQYPNATGWAGWTQQEMTELIGFINTTSALLSDAQPVWLGPTYALPSSYSPMAWYGLNYTIAQWAWTANLANSPQNVNQAMGTILIDQMLYRNGPQLTGLYDTVVNHLWANGKLNLWFYEDVQGVGISAVLGGNELQAESTFHIYSSAGGSTSFTVLSSVDSTAEWIASGYAGQSYTVPSGYKGVYAPSLGFTSIAGFTSDTPNTIAAGYYKNSATGNFLLTDIPSGSYCNTLLLPRDMINKMLYWVSACPINSSQSLLDLKILELSNGTIIIPMTNQRDVGNTAGPDTGWSITATLNINARALGLGSPSNYKVYWDSSGNHVIVTNWDSVPITLNGMSDSLVIVPS